MSDEPVKDPKTRYFMGWEKTSPQMAAEEEAAMADDVYLVHTKHIWPLMGFAEADARWKLGQTKEVELYALCGVRLRSFLRDRHGLPVEYGEHWHDDSSLGESDSCAECESKWAALTEQPPAPPTPRTVSAPMFVALHTAEPGDSGAHEVSGGGYARQPVTFTAAVGTMTFESTNEQRFPDMPKTMITHFTIRDAQDQVLFHGALTQPKETKRGDTASFAPGNLRIKP